MRRYGVGLAGLVVVLVGVITTIVAEHVLPEPPDARRFEHSMDVDVGKVKLAWRSKPQAPPGPEAQPIVSRAMVRKTGAVFGTIALPFAVASWIRRERPWMGVAICGFALAAIAWQTFVIVAAVLLVAILFAAFWPA